MLFSNYFLVSARSITKNEYSHLSPFMGKDIDDDDYDDYNEENEERENGEL